jgi:hypothetical protein
VAIPLPDDLETEIGRLFDEGEALLDEEEDAQALTRFQEAWALVPEPKGEWERALQLLGGIADCQFFLGSYEDCRLTMQLALRSGGDVDNPFICLRLGQCYLKLGNEVEAGNWLLGAMVAGGVEIFDGEDPEYWAFLKKRLDPPPGGWREGL